MRFERKFSSDTAKSPPDPRTPGQRDRDRILYCPQFRRLAEVTQVVGSQETELFHNRLTHSLEVAQIARRIAERLVADGGRAAELVDPDVVEAAALAHDIGHPPFGHIAEEVLDELVIAENLQDGFEGNAQSFRIVTTLAHRSDKHYGLDLTRASLQGLSKYPWERRTSGKRHRKYGSFDSEGDQLKWSRSGLPSELVDEQTAEASIMDWADDVAYALHDMEDFFRVGLVPLDRLARGDGAEQEQGRFLARTFDRWTQTGFEFDRAAYEQTADTLFAEFPTEPWVEAASRGTMNHLVPSKINLYTTGVQFNASGGIDEDQDLLRELHLLKSLAWTYVIESPALAAQQYGQKALIRVLFDYYSETVRKNPHALPSWARAYVNDEELMAKHESAKDAEVRIACDVVASLSERQAYAVYSRLTGRTPGSVMESILR